MLGEVGVTFALYYGIFLCDGTEEFFSCVSSTQKLLIIMGENFFHLRYFFFVTGDWHMAYICMYKARVL